MKRGVFVLAMVFAGGALAQQNTDISGADLDSGAADARLAGLGRQAQASGKRLVITAPQHWHGRIASAIRAGGSADIVLRDGFYESVLVRIEDKPAEPPKPEPARPEPAPVVRAAPAVERPAAPASRPPPPAPAPAQTAPVRPAATAPAVPSEPPPRTPEPVPQPAVPPPSPPPAPIVEVQSEPEPEAEPAADTSADAQAEAASGPFLATEPGDVTPDRVFLEKQYNGGKRITTTIQPKELEIGDVIYTGQGAAVVVRRDRNTLLRYWLVGEIDLRQTGISTEGRNKYRLQRQSVR